VLEGSVRTSGSRLRVTTQLTDVASGYQVWSERYDREAADIFAVQDEIAAGVVEAVKARLVPGGPAVRSRPQVGNLEAYREYLKARHLRYMKADYVGALSCYARAVDLDPSNASSWVGLADVNVVASFYNLIPAADAFAAAKHALATAARLQGESVEALFVEGMIAGAERAWRTAERVVLRAIELQPGYAQARCWNAWRLNAFGRLEEALQQLQHARDVDPLAPYPYAMTGVTWLCAGRAAEAMRYFDQALTFERENILAQWGAGLALVAAGRPADGIALLERATALTRQGGLIHGSLGWALAAAGRTDDARKVLDVLQSRPDSAPAVVSHAWLLAALNQPSDALDVLERAAQENQLSLVLIGLPGYDPLRADPRFRALVARLGFPPRA
jgi:serine/threonine-protein kinase